MNYAEQFEAAWFQTFLNACREVRMDALRDLVVAKLDRIDQGLFQRNCDLADLYDSSKKEYLWRLGGPERAEMDSNWAARNTIRALKKEVILDFAGAKGSWL